MSDSGFCCGVSCGCGCDCDGLHRSDGFLLRVPSTKNVGSPSFKFLEQKKETEKQKEGKKNERHFKRKHTHHFFFQLSLNRHNRKGKNKTHEDDVTQKPYTHTHTKSTHSSGCGRRLQVRWLSWVRHSGSVSTVIGVSTCSHGRVWRWSKWFSI